jgi:NADP-dependent alcohol dehydrogenase
MLNFEYCNPTRLVFGKGEIAKLPQLIPEGFKNILVLYGGGSIKKNGVYSQVIKGLNGRNFVEIGGVQSNPLHELCMDAVKKIKENHIEFVLAVGGGSVFDSAKYIAAACLYDGDDPYDILRKQISVKEAMPWGGVLTIPATGSEMNPNSVISRESTGEKLPFESDLVRPLFSILDPETTYSLPERQIVNGVVDAYVHVIEQYITYPVNADLQDRFAESILTTLLDIGPKILKDPGNYDLRATMMLCATQALNFWFSWGMPYDFASHDIGHELTAIYGIDHAASIAIVLPGVWQYKRKQKAEKLIQYAERVFGISTGTPDERIDAAINKTEEFFQSLGLKTTLKDYGIPAEDCNKIGERLWSWLEKVDMPLGEHHDIEKTEIIEILKLRTG